MDTFDSLLYLDKITHSHAFLLASNLNLKYYYYNMFNKYSGSLFNVVLRTDLLYLTNGIVFNYNFVMQDDLLNNDLMNNHYLYGIKNCEQKEKDSIDFFRV